MLDREGARRRRRNRWKISLFIPDAVHCCLVLLRIMGMHLLLQKFFEERKKGCVLNSEKQDIETDIFAVLNS